MEASHRWKISEFAMQKTGVEFYFCAEESFASNKNLMENIIRQKIVLEFFAMS